MAERKGEKENQEEQQPPVPKRSRKRLFIIVGASISGLILLIGLPVFLMSKGSVKDVSVAEPLLGENNQSGEQQEDEELQEGEEIPGAFYPLDTFIVNIADGKFLRAQIQLEFIERSVPSRYYARQVPVRDALITFFASQTTKDLVEDPTREVVKKKAKDVINEVLRSEEVKNVYFTHFVVQ